MRDVIHDLHAIVIKSVTENGKRISLVLIVLNLFHKISQDIEFDVNDINIMFSMLALRPDLPKSTNFSDLNYVMNFIPQLSWKHIADVLGFFINMLLPSNNLDNTDWVFVVPLMHALDEKLTSLEKVNWRDDCFDISKMGRPGPNAILK